MLNVKRTGALLLVLVLIVSAFYSGNFMLAKSETHASATIGSVRSANATFNEGFCVYPDSRFGKMVAAELKSRGHKVLTLSDPAECDGQFLAVWIKWFNVSYSPVFAKGSMRVLLIYSSAGDPAQYLRYRNSTEKVLIGFERTRKPQVQAYIRLDISDTSKGILSFRGYREYLLKSAAKDITDSVLNLRRESAEATG